MERIAAWRRGPNDPTVDRRWLVRLGGDPSRSPEEARADARSTWLALGVLSVCLTLCALLLVALPHARLLAVALSLALPVSAVVHGVRQRTRSATDAAPEELPDAFGARLFVLDRRGLSTGGDRGLLLFCDGWLLFEGARTSFAVTTRDASARVEGDRLRLILADGRRALLIPVGEGSRIEGVERALAGWARSAIPEGDAVLPPTAVHPEALAGRWGLCVACALSFGLVAAGTAALALWAVFGLSLALGLACLGAARGNARRLRLEASKVLPSSALAFPPPPSAE